MGKHTPPMFTTIIDDGAVFDSQVLSESELEDVELLVDHALQMCDFEMKECFHNAQILVLAEDHIGSENLNHGIRYYEGYFIREDLPIPIHHGWIAINGKIVDLTIRQTDLVSPLESFEDRTIGEIPSSVSYIGIEISKDDVLSRIEDSSETHTILDDWNPKYRHLKEKYLKLRSNPKLQSFEQRLQSENNTLSSDSPIWFRGAKGHGEKGLGLGAMGLGLYLTRNPNIAQIYANYSKGMVLKYFVNMDIEVLDTESPQYFDCLQFAVNEARLNPNMTRFLQELIEDKDFIGFYNKYYQVLSGYEPFENALSECIKSLGYRGVYSHDENFGLVLFYPDQDSIPFFKII